MGLILKKSDSCSDFCFFTQIAIKSQTSWTSTSLTTIPSSLSFPRTTYKITYTLLGLLWTPTHLAKHQNPYLPWQLFLFSLRSSFNPALVPDEQMKGLAAKFSPFSTPLLPFLSHDLLCGCFNFLSSTSREPMLPLWELQDMSFNFQQKVLLEDRETVKLENPGFWWQCE